MRRANGSGLIYRVCGTFIVMLLLVTNLANSMTEDEGILGAIVTAIQNIFFDPAASTNSTPPSPDPGQDTTQTDGQNPVEPPPPPPDPD
jgi:hypothetical protein